MSAKSRCLLLVGALFGLSSCGDGQTSLAAQNDRQASTPYAEVVDNHGCKWRINLNSRSFAEPFPVIKPDGTVDCPQPVKAPTPEPKP